MASKKKQKEQVEGTVEQTLAEGPQKQPSQNGVTRPRSGTATGRVWEIADELSAAAGEPVARKDVMAQAKEEGLNEATIATQYGRWRRFHGLARPNATKQQADEPSEVEVTEDDE